MWFVAKLRSGPTVLEVEQVTFRLHALKHVTAVSRSLRSRPAKFTGGAETANGLYAARRRALARGAGYTRVAGERVRGAWRLVIQQYFAAMSRRRVALRPII